MPRPFCRTWLLALLTFCVPAVAAEPEAGAPDLASRVESLIRDGIERGAVAELFDACMLQEGTLAPVLDRLDALIAADETAATDRDAARRARGLLAWRLGDLDDALTAFEALLDGAAPDAMIDVRYDRARLLDALGRLSNAREAYEALLETVEDDEIVAAIQLRLALIGLDKPGGDAEALGTFARERGDDALRNRAGVVLAILGRPDDAIDIFVVEGEGTIRFRQETRVAEWAIRAEDAEAAQAAAWRAVEAAELSRDRHYALAVLLEAHRMDESLDALLERFEAAALELDDDARAAWDRAAPRAGALRRRHPALRRRQRRLLHG